MEAAGAKPQSNAGHDRIPALDGVRGLAILAVVLHHMFDIKLLWMGVDLFFVLSGFLITGILVRSAGHSFPRYIGHFYKRRAQRILPAYLLTLAITALLWGNIADLHRYWYYYIGGMNFLVVLNKPFYFSLPLWSLAVEEQFYLLWPLAIFWLPRRFLLPLTAALVVLAPVLRYVFTPYFNAPWAMYTMLPFRMDCLALGGLLALLWPRLGHRVKGSNVARVALVLAGAAAVALAMVGFLWLNRHGITMIQNTRVGNTLLYLCSLTCVFYVMVLALLGMLQPLFAFKPLVWLGTVSYSLYLCHLNFKYLFMWRTHLPYHDVWAIACALLYSAASWYWLEKPILRLGRNDQRTVTSQFST